MLFLRDDRKGRLDVAVDAILVNKELVSIFTGDLRIDVLSMPVDMSP